MLLSTMYKNVMNIERVKSKKRNRNKRYSSKQQVKGKPRQTFKQAKIPGSP